MAKDATRRRFMQKLVLGSQSVMHDPGASTVVCIFLRGGADTLNMFVPYSDPEYYKTRPTIAIPANAAIKLNDTYALHPKMKPLLPIYMEGRLGVVQGVGSDNPTGSHFEAQDQMERGEAYGSTIGGGWLGRYLSTRTNTAMTPLCAVSIGTTIPESLRGAPTSSAITSVDDLRLSTPTGKPQEASAILSALYGCDVGILSEPGKSTLQLLKRVDELKAKTGKRPTTASYPNTQLGNGLKEIASLIRAEAGLEVACIDFGNWDTHFVQGGVDGLQAKNIADLADSLAAFDGDLDGHRDKVLTLIMTEFGRRTYENGSLGTDHGRGFAFFAMGKGVNGGKIHGRWLGLEKQEADLLGPSGLMIEHDYRSVLAEALAALAGKNHVHSVFPGFNPATVGLISARARA